MTKPQALEDTSDLTRLKSMLPMDAALLVEVEDRIHHQPGGGQRTIPMVIVYATWEAQFTKYEGHGVSRYTLKGEGTSLEQAAGRVIQQMELVR